MTRSKHLVTELQPNDHQATVTYGDKSMSKVSGFGKVVVAPNITLVSVMLVETIGYNLLSVCALSKMGFSVFFEPDLVVLLWSETLEVAFVGYVENELYVVDFSGSTERNLPASFGTPVVQDPGKDLLSIFTIISFTLFV